MPDGSGSDRLQSFEAAALPHLRLLYQLAHNLTGNLHEAEDLVQETFLKAYRGYPRLRHHSNVRAWLCRILSNLFLDNRRRRQHEAKPLTDEGLEQFSLYKQIWDEDPLPYSENLHRDFMAQFRDDDVRSAVNMLPEHYRVPVVLCYVEEFTYKELSQILKVPIGTVMSRLNRGRKLLEKALWEHARRLGYIKEWK